MRDSQKNSNAEEIQNSISEIPADVSSSENVVMREVETRKKRKLRGCSSILIAFLLLLIAVNLLPGGRRFFRNAVYSALPTEPSVLVLEGAPYDIGKKHGSECSWSISALCGIYIKKILSGGSESRYKKNAAIAEKIFKNIPERWTREIKGIADGAGVEPEALMLGNTFLDIGEGMAGCRQVIAFSHDGVKKRLLHSHNLDWNNLGGIGNFVVTVFRTNPERGRFRTVRVDFPGMVGTLSIINEKGISLAFNQLGFSKGNVKGLPVLIALRDIAETCATFAEADKRVRGMPEGMPFCIGLADAKSLKCAVYERDREGNIFVRKPQSFVLTADNTPHYGEQMRRSPVEEAAQSAGIFNETSDKQDLPLQKLKTVMRNKRVLLDCNLYSVIFDWANNRFYLASGKIPAATGKYREYILFP